ncbi:hypothetical protein [Vibrio sp. D431a]|uniref:hypothetical protein n=1 Tax=Vibrio sp. D431a TaxID=2837388 RepID=UPI0025561DBC|nr:hypothetical protein [Vibrio sp. D431a]MDK9793756.1 hypothetical protein [Vibrio sp. D431a]
MANKLIKCPKCRKSKLIISEEVLVNYSNVYDGGVFVGEFSEKPMNTIRQIATCLNPDCKHEWTFRKQVELSDIPTKEAEQKPVEFTCTHCKKPRKQMVQPLSKFDPSKDKCNECIIGISDEH